MALQVFVPKTNPIWAFRSFQFFAFIFFLAHFVALIDLGFADTELIAPTNRAFILGAGWLAAVVAFGIIMLAPLGVASVSPFAIAKIQDDTVAHPSLRGCAVLSGLAFGHLAWRAEENRGLFRQQRAFSCAKDKG